MKNTETTPTVDATGQDAEKVYSRYFIHFYSKKNRLTKNQQKNGEKYMDRALTSLKNAIMLNNLQRI